MEASAQSSYFHLSLHPKQEITLSSCSVCGKTLEGSTHTTCVNCGKYFDVVSTFVQGFMLCRVLHCLLSESELCRRSITGLHSELETLHEVFSDIKPIKAGVKSPTDTQTEAQPVVFDPDTVPFNGSFVSDHAHISTERTRNCSQRAESELNPVPYAKHDLQSIGAKQLTSIDNKLCHEENTGMCDSKFTCNDCGVVFRKRPSLRCHVRKHHMEAKLTCRLCGRQCFAPQGLTLHMRVVHKEEKASECRICGEKFSKPRMLARHKERMHKKTEHFCHLCRRYLQSENSLASHMLKHSAKGTAGCLQKSSCQEEKIENKEKESKYVCKACGSEFSYRDALSLHIRKFHREAHLTCHICGRKCYAPTGLKLHIRLVHKEHKVAVCSVCGERFPSQQLLRQHEKSHKEKSQTCHVCGKHFQTRGGFKAHLLAHTGIKRYFCEFCGRGFLLSGSLWSHRVRAHNFQTNSRNLRCRTCSVSFLAVKLKRAQLSSKQCSVCFEKTVSTLESTGVTVDRDRSIKDTVRVHEGECKVCQLFPDRCPIHKADDTSKEMQNSVPCSVCGEHFSNRTLLRKHMSSHKSHRPYKCSVCEKDFSCSKYLRVHMDQHKEKKFACDVCGKTFTYKFSLNSHRKVHVNAAQAEFKCEVCNKTFKGYRSLSGHRQQHLTAADRKFQCEICGSWLKTKKTLRSHLKKYHRLDQSEIDQKLSFFTESSVSQDQFCSPLKQI